MILVLYPISPFANTRALARAFVAVCVLLFVQPYLDQTMASAQFGGYDDERFENPVPHENLHCAICLNVLKEPMQCTRNEHFFCQPCITRHLAQTRRCPTCIEPLTIQTLRPARFAKNLISQLKIRCDNAGRGCADMVKLEKLESHVANCEFGPIQCSNNGCEVIINRKDQLKHEMNDCNFRQGKCEVCGKNMAYRKRMLHCYVTRNEMDNMKDEMLTIKEIVMNMSREFTRHMGDMKNQMGDMKEQMGELRGQVRVQMDNMSSGLNNLKRDFEKMKRKEKSVSLVTRSQENWNVRKDIIVAGAAGEDNLKSVEMFSWLTRQWTLLRRMKSKRWLSSSFVYKGQMFVCGGTWSGDTIESLELKEERGEWKEFQGKLPQKTCGHANTIYEENLFIFGGENGGEVVNDIFKVDLVSHSSQLVSHLPEPRSDHGAQCFGDKVAIVGGTSTGDYSGSLRTVLLYDIKRSCCQALAPLPFPVCRMATVALEDNIIIIGGRGENGNALNTVVSYNITNEQSTMLPSMRHKRYGCSAVITGNVIVVMGGLNEDSGELNSVESFRFDNYSWEELPPMKEEREGATAVVNIFCK